MKSILLPDTMKHKFSKASPKIGLVEADPRAGTAGLKYHICEIIDQRSHTHLTPSTKDFRG